MADHLRKYESLSVTLSGAPTMDLLNIFAQIHSYTAEDADDCRGLY
jgi:hypothetical protein